MHFIKTFGLGILLVGAGLPAGAKDPAGVDALAWMAGSWGGAQGHEWVEELWLEPRGGLMLGTARSGDKKQAKAFEFLRIAAGPDGVPVCWASPAGGEAVPFRLIASRPNSAIFENVRNPYPKRIRYQRLGASLEVTIEGANGENQMTWNWRRLAGSAAGESAPTDTKY